MPAEQWVLPMGVSSVGDIGQLQRELEAVSGFLQQAAVRQPGTPLQLPKTGKLFEEMTTSNNLNMLQENDRNNLTVFLQALRDKAPVIHISFNTEPSPFLIQRLITWMRQNIHHFVLLKIGLNPGIGAGCVVRTNNKYFDFSLRQRFTNQRGLLMDQLRGPHRASEANSARAPIKTVKTTAEIPQQAPSVQVETPGPSKEPDTRPQPKQATQEAADGN